MELDSSPATVDEVVMTAFGCKWHAWKAGVTMVSNYFNLNIHVTK
jgi:hypothetical protein